MTELPLLEFLRVAVLLGLGIAMQLLKVLGAMSQAKGVRVGALALCRQRPYKLTSMLIGAVVGYLAILEQVANPPALMIIAVGYSANDMLDWLGSKVRTKVTL